MEDKNQDKSQASNEISSRYSNNPTKFASSTNDFRSNQSRNIKREKKNQKVNVDNFLSFKIAAKKEPPPVRFKKQQQKGLCDITLSPYCNFALRLPIDLSVLHTDPNIPLDWDSIGMVTRLSSNELKCPICLEHEFVASRVNRCGHIFCWPCVIRYLWATEKDSKRCPICFDTVRGSFLRPLVINHVKPVREGDSIELQLIMREKGKISLFKCGEPILERVFQSFVDQISSNSKFNRITVQFDERSVLENQRSQLEIFMSKTNDSFEKSATEKALEYVNKEIDGSKVSYVEARNIDEPQRNMAKYYYFYQVADGQPYFLHPLNIKMMLKEYGGFENFPAKISGKVLELDDIFITEQEIKKMG